MKGKALQKVLIGSMVCLFFSCNSNKEESPPASVNKEEIKKQIQAKEDEFAATYNAGVLKDIGYYADDATSFFQNRPALVGKEAIVEFLKADLASASRNK